MACRFGDCIKVEVGPTSVMLWSTLVAEEYLLVDRDEWDDFIADVKEGKYDQNN